MSEIKVTKDHSIRAAGMVQAVIASGAPHGEWFIRTKYGLRLQNYYARLLAGAKNLPIPEFPKESN